ncbi:MAG: hypothetical protein IPJ58_06540 [Ardenticatenia bacterium]|nr:hypothetical protein [Ardenticatenia bacterium]MBK8541522.1 hypothetical protein [Ardenticatenia bacterium]HRA19600.1 hypothetical protein [Anaerolineae bacterium]
MSERGEVADERPDDPIPWQQALTDDVFLLMMAGLVVPTLFYIVWGLLELANVKIFTP